jgi:hypothetical protein
MKQIYQPLNLWNTSKVTNMYQMFYSTPFNQNISNWNVTKVTNWNYFSTPNTLANNYKPLFK